MGIQAAPDRLRRLAAGLRAAARPRAAAVEAGGPHAVAIARHDLREELPAGLRLACVPGHWRVLWR